MKQDAWQGFVSRLPDNDHQFSQTQLGVVFHSLCGAIIMVYGHGNGDGTPVSECAVVNLCYKFGKKTVEVGVSKVHDQYRIGSSKVSGKPVGFKYALYCIDFGQISRDCARDARLFCQLEDSLTRADRP